MGKCNIFGAYLVGLVRKLLSMIQNYSIIANFYDLTYLTKALATTAEYSQLLGCTSKGFRNAISLSAAVEFQSHFVY